MMIEWLKQGKAEEANRVLEKISRKNAELLARDIDKNTLGT